jgi:hypothetical protein
MPITPFLDGQSFDSETKRIMGLAFEMACIALHIADHDDRAKEPIARSIIELAEAGENNPDVLCERVLARLRGPSGEMERFEAGAPGAQVPVSEPKQEPL